MMDAGNFLTPRLRCVASFAEEGCRLADVGTDHAYIPIWLVQKGIAKSAIAMDINKGPLTRADENIKRFSLEDKVSTRLSNGLEKLCPGEADTVVIAGMGGMLINEILDAAKHVYSSVRRYILQPMTAVEETRTFLAENGFAIESEQLAQEDEKVYCILSVVRGKMEIPRKIDAYIGEKLVAAKDPLLSKYLDGKIYECDKAIGSLRAAEGTKAEERLSHFTYLSREMKKIREECAKW